EFLATNPGIDAITFTGESRTGAQIMRSAADGVRDVSFELGGKNAAVVFADCDFDKAVEGVKRSSLTNSGQVCLCSERVYVERPIFDRFVAALKDKAESFRIGYADAQDVDMGPMISHDHRDHVLGYFQLAGQEGASVVTAGGIPQFGDERDAGAYVQPTIWTGLADDARCMREAVFGPVCHIAPFDSVEEVVERVNDSDYGLAAAVWTRDIKHAHQVSRRFKVGMVWVNTWFLRDLRTPFGGSGLSGLGREGGRYSLDFYSELTTICVNP